MWRLARLIACLDVRRHRARAEESTVPLMFGAPDMVTCAHLAMDNVMETHAYVLDCAAAAAEEAGVSYTTMARWGALPDMLMRTADEADGEVIVVGSPACAGWRWP